MTAGSELRVLCVSGPSGSGKTTLIRRLLSALPSPRDRIGVVKHTHHPIDWHPAGKDSRVLWDAGPSVLCVAGPDQTACFVRPDEAPGERPDGGEGAADRRRNESAPAEEPSPEATRRLVHVCERLRGDVELVLAEGFGDARAPKLWTAGGGPPAEPLPGPEVLGAVVPGRHAAAWAERHPGLTVHRRGDVEEIAALAAEIARPLSGIATRPPDR